MSGLQCSYEEHLKNLHHASQGNTHPSRVEVRDTGSLSISHSVIGIPINFEQESGMVTC